ncbi:MAG: hypothetical protein RLZZ116_2357 [Planctomycetota bacterium]|jgi:hypothetical protein
MLKFLRQYNQWILVVGGTLLLITFLMPTAIQGLAQQSAVSGVTWATYSGGAVTGADLEQSQQELRVIEAMGNTVVNGLGAEKDPAHWWLLAHEAKEAGLVGGKGEGEAALAQIATSLKVSPDQALYNISRSTGTSPDVVLETLAKLQGVNRLVGLSIEIDRVSDQRLKRAIARAGLAVSGDLTIIDARKNSSIEAAAPTEEKLAEQLKKYAETDRPADGAIGKESFGYRLPDRFKLEWLTISKAAVAATIESSPELATLALKKRYAQDPRKYGGVDASNFAALETSIRRMVTDELVKARMDEIAKFAGDQLSLAQRSLKRDGAHFALPSDWGAQMPSLQSLAQAVATEYGIAAPTYQSSGTEWMSATKLRELPGIGAARTTKYGTPIAAPELVAGAKEFAKPNLAAPIQVNIASPALTTDAGDVCFLRIIEVDPAKAATDLATVRAEVEKDIIAIARFDWLDANKDAIAAAASKDGIRSVADKYGTTVEFAKDVAEANLDFLRFGYRMGSGLPSLNNDGKIIEAIIAKASKIPFATDMNTIPAEQRTIAVAVPERLSLVVLQVSAMRPVTEERYSELAGSIMTSGSNNITRATRDASMTIDPQELFGFDALSKRYGFKTVRAAEDMPSGGAPIPPLDSPT